MKKQFAILLCLLFVPVFTTHATSGACSWHGGVDCDRGWQSNGKVYCNDSGWTDSMVFYEYMVMCEDEKFAPECVDYIKGKDEYLGHLDGMIDKTKDYILSQKVDMSNPYVANRMQNYMNYLGTLRGKQNQRYIDMARICTDDLEKKKQDYLKSTQYSPLKNKEETPISSMKMFLKGLEEASETLKNTLPSKKKVNSLIDIKNSIKEEAENKILVCTDGYGLSLDKTKCIKIPENAYAVDSPTDVWLCSEGYQEENNKCVKEYKKEIIEIKNQENLLTHDNLIVKSSMEDIINDYQQNDNSVKESANQPTNIVGIKIKLFFNSLVHKLTNVFKF